MALIGVTILICPGNPVNWLVSDFAWPLGELYSLCQHDLWMIEISPVYFVKKYFLFVQNLLISFMKDAPVVMVS